MSTNIHRGSPLALLQSVSRKSSPVNGYTVEAEYRGFSTAQFTALALYMYNNGFEYQWDTRFDVHTLNAVDTSGQTTIDNWEVAVNKLCPSSLENIRNISTIDASNLQILYYSERHGLDLTQAIEQLKLDTGVGTATATILADFQADAEAVRLYSRLKKGSTSFYQSGYVIRHTTNVRNRYDSNISDANVDRIYTPAQLLSEAQNANLWTYPLPGRLAYKIGMIPAPAFRLNYLWGWLKSASTESTAANNRVNICTEYELGQWSTDEYNTV